MILEGIDQKIRKAFSSAAVQYDVLASLHREIGRELTKKLTHQEFSAILDIGMGTGWLTQRLKNFFPEAFVVGMDVAEGMIAQAKEREGDFHIVEADAKRLPFRSKSFDCIVSNLSFQWIGVQTHCFKDCFTLLKKKGIFSLTLFGFNTFQELFLSLEEAHHRRKLDIQRLPKEEQISQTMEQVGFQKINIHKEWIQVRFPNMMALLKWAKGLGANLLAGEAFFGKDLLARAQNYYHQNFCDHLGPYATFEVIWVEAKKE